MRCERTLLPAVLHLGYTLPESFLPVTATTITRHAELLRAAATQPSFDTPLFARHKKQEPTRLLQNDNQNDTQAAVYLASSDGQRPAKNFSSFDMPNHNPIMTLSYPNPSLSDMAGVELRNPSLSSESQRHSAKDEPVSRKRAVRQVLLTIMYGVPFLGKHDLGLTYHTTASAWA